MAISKKTRNWILIGVGSAGLLTAGYFLVVKPRMKKKPVTAPLTKDKADAPAVTTTPDPLADAFFKHVQGWINAYTKEWSKDATKQKDDAIYQTYDQWSKAGSLKLPDMAEATPLDATKFPNHLALKQYLIDNGKYETLQTYV